MNRLTPILALGIGGTSLTDATLVLRGAGSMWWVLPLLLAAIAIAVLSYRLHADASPRMRLLLSVIRGTLLLLIGLMLLEPVVRLVIDGSLRRSITVLVDSSASMLMKDRRTEPADLARGAIATGAVAADAGVGQAVPADRVGEIATLSRVDIVRTAMRNLSISLLPRLAKEYDIKPVGFGAKSQDIAIQSDDPIAWTSGITAGEPTTALGDAVRQAMTGGRGQPMAGILLITDGQGNAGGSALAAAEAARIEGMPLYIWGVGISKPRDVAVASVLGQDVTFINERIPITVRLRSTGLAGRLAEVTLKLGDQPAATQSVTLTDAAEQIVTIPLEPKTAGEFEMSVSVAPIDDEATDQNNRVARQIRVIDRKIRVLHIESRPRWEFKYLQAMLLRDRRVDYKCVLLEADRSVATGDESPYLPEIPNDRQKLLDFDLIILGDVDPAAIGPQRMGWVSEFVSDFGGGLVMVAGKDMTPAAYRGTPLEALIPMEIVPPDAATPSPIVGGGGIRVQRTPIGRQSPMLRLAEDLTADAAAWESLAPLQWVAELGRAKPATEILLAAADPAMVDAAGEPKPILALGRYGQGQVLLLATDNTWRWRRNDGQKSHVTFWGQVVQRMALPHLLGGAKRTQLTVDRQDYTAGERITVYGRIFDETYQPWNQDSVPAGLHPGEGEDAPGSGAVTPLILRALPGQPGMFRGEVVAPKAGKYQVLVNHDPSSPLDLNVGEPRLESGETAMNEALLRDMAAVSGGEFLREEDLHSLPERIAAKTPSFRVRHDIAITEGWPWFGMILALAGLEWVLRRKAKLK